MVLWSNSPARLLTDNILFCEVNGLGGDREPKKKSDLRKIQQKIQMQRFVIWQRGELGAEMFFLTLKNIYVFKRYSIWISGHSLTTKLILRIKQKVFCFVFWFFVGVRGGDWGADSSNWISKYHFFSFDNW